MVIYCPVLDLLCFCCTTLRDVKLVTLVYPIGTRAWYIRPEYVEAHGVAKAQMKDSSNLRTLDFLKKKKLKIESLKRKTLTCNRLDLLPET